MIFLSSVFLRTVNRRGIIALYEPAVSINKENFKTRRAVRFTNTLSKLTFRREVIDRRRKTTENYYFCVNPQVRNFRRD